MTKSQSQTKKLPILNIAVFIAVFFMIGVALGPNLNQVYTGISATGSDTVELTNNGNLDTKVRDFSLSTVDRTGVGGVVTVDGDYTVHTFLTSDTFVLPVDLVASVLVVGGGGGGGAAYSGGGGAGGFIEEHDYSLTAQSYSVIVGTGGTGGVLPYGDGGNGANSVFSSLEAIGGGGGVDAGTGNTGGSGGGGSDGGSGGAGTVGQGNDGGSGYSGGAYVVSGGGGGGAGTVGGNGASAVNGDGGDGLESLLSGSSVYYSGGGGGGTGDYVSIVSGGIGGGGDGGDGSHGVSNTGGGGGGGTMGLVGGNGADGIVIIRFLTPVVETVDPAVSVGDDKLYYDGTLSSTLIYSDGSAYIDSSDVSASMKGSLPIIKVGTTQNIKIDHDLQYSITYIPKNMDITSPDMYRAGEDMRVDTRLTETSGNPTSYQPLEMRIRLFDSNDKLYLDDIASSTSFVIPGKYLHDNKHYQLRLSYEGYEFGGWSNEILADFDIGTEGFTITSSPDKAPEGVMAASFAAVEGLVGMAVTGWLDVPIIGDIIRFIADLVGVEL